MIFSEDLYCYLFDFLDPVDLLKLCCVNRYFYEFANTPLCSQYREHGCDIMAATQTRSTELFLWHAKISIQVDLEPSMLLAYAVRAKWEEIIPVFVHKYPNVMATAEDKIRVLRAACSEHDSFAKMSMTNLLVNKYGCQPEDLPEYTLPRACKRGDYDLAVWLVEECGFSPHANFNEALIAASMNDKVEIAKWLVEKHACNTAILVGEPMHEMYMKGCIQTLYWLHSVISNDISATYLLLALAGSKQTQMFLEVMDNYQGENVDFLACTLGNKEISDVLIYQRGMVVNDNFIINTSLSRNLNQIAWLLETMPDRATQLFPLIGMCAHGSVELLERALSLTKLDVPAILPELTERCAKKGRNDLLEWLFTKYKFDHVAHNNLLLNSAALSGRTDTIKYLVDEHGYSPRFDNDVLLVTAAGTGNDSLVRWLIETCACDPKAHNNEVIIQGVSTLELGTIKWMLDMYDDIGSINNRVLEEACNSTDPLVLRALIVRRFDPKPIGNIIIAKVCLNHPLELVQLVVEKGCDPTSADALFAACAAQNKKIVKWLLSKGANIHSVYERVIAYAQDGNIPVVEEWFKKLYAEVT